MSLLEGKDILIVEDDPIFRNMVSAFLQHQGCSVRYAEDGLQGLKALQNAIPDLMLCDLSMPVMSGMEFVEEAVVQYPMLPIIVVSGTGAMADVATALRLGVKDYLVKPLDNFMVLKSAMMTVFKAADIQQGNAGDASTTWPQRNDTIDEELAWHFEELDNDPIAARELLTGLMPEVKSSCGSWQLNYYVLQTTDKAPVLLDYTWLMDGRLAFYVIDCSSCPSHGTAIALLIRAFFNDYLRQQRVHESHIIELLQEIEKHIKNSRYTSNIKCIFGLFDVVNHQLNLMPAGIGGSVQTSEENHTISGQAWLGQKAFFNQGFKLKIAPSGARLSLSEIDCANFSITLQHIPTH